MTGDHEVTDAPRTRAELEPPVRRPWDDSAGPDHHRVDDDGWSGHTRPIDGGPVTEPIPQPLAVPADPRVARARTWHGGVEPYVAGSPGNAGEGLLVRPDPRAPHRPDTVLDGYSVLDDSDRPLVEVRAASVRGRAHRHAARTRQDEYAVRRTADGRHLVAVVADGVSAGEHSHRAATVAAQRGSELLCGWLAERPVHDVPWGTLVSQLSEDILVLGRRLWDRSTPEDVPAPGDREIARTLATTALFAVVELTSWPGTAGCAVHLFQVGDSSAWVLREGRRWEPQQPVKNSGVEVASAATRALPTPGPVLEPVRTVLAPTDVLALVTDGLGDPLLDGDNDFGDYLADCWARPPAALAFAAQVDVARKSFDDDRTAVAIWPRES